MIKAYSLFSGSSGNCFFIDAGCDKILIDAGVSERRISHALEELGVKFDDISAIFITHEHIDHTRGLETISKKHDIPIHMTVGTAHAAITSPLSPVLARLYAHKDCFSALCGALKVSAFNIPHDAAQPVGYIVEKDGVRLGFCTDTGCITDEMTKNLVGCRAAVIEANHDGNMLLLGPYPYSLKMRISSDTGHLSNDDAATLARALCDGGAKSLMLAHLSKENNTPKIAYDAVSKAVCGKAEIFVASPDAIRKLVVK